MDLFTCGIFLFLILTLPRIHDHLTKTKGWRTEGWLPFFKKVLTGKLRYEKSTCDHLPD